MNLTRNPTRKELQALLAACDDTAAHHVAWVGYDGAVHIDPLPEDLTPVGFAELNKAAIKFRLETCERGNGYVGPNAAQDEKWVDRLFAALQDFWTKHAEGYQDVF